MFKVITLIFIAVVLLIAVLKRKEYNEFILEHKRDVFIPILAPFGFYVLDKLKLYKRMPRFVASVHQKAIMLRGSRHAETYTRIHLAKVIVTTVIGILITLLVAGNSEEGINTNGLIFGIVFTFVLTIAQAKSLNTKVKKRKEDIIIELPEFVNKVILLVNAGDTVQGAFQKCLQKNRKRIHTSPWYYELNEAMNKLSTNATFQDVMKELNLRCSVQEVSVFTTTIMMNYRRGGKQLVDSLQDLSKNLWEKRKTITKIKGEEASSKMLFPLMIVFVAVMMLIIYPAVASFMFGQN